MPRACNLFYHLFHQRMTSKIFYDTIGSMQLLTSIHMHANIIQRRAPQPDEQSASGQKIRLPISFCRLRFPLPSQAYICLQGKIANPFRGHANKASFALARLFFLAPEPKDHIMRARKQSRVSLDHVHIVLKSSWQFICLVSITDEWGSVVQMPGTVLETFCISQAKSRAVTICSHAKTRM